MLKALPPDKLQATWKAITKRARRERPVIHWVGQDGALGDVPNVHCFPSHPRPVASVAG
jgi:hypothetical protein